MIVEASSTPSTEYLSKLADRMDPLTFLWEAETMHRLLLERGYSGKETAEIDTDEWHGMVQQSIGQQQPVGAKS